jgi:hypothetical protein
MRVELIPAAEGDLAAAIERELDDLVHGGRGLPEVYRSRWRRAGLEEGVRREGEEPTYAVSPRSRRGAERA